MNYTVTPPRIIAVCPVCAHCSSALTYEAARDAMIDHRRYAHIEIHG